MSLEFPCDSTLKVVRNAYNQQRNKKNEKLIRKLQTNELHFNTVFQFTRKANMLKKRHRRFRCLPKKNMFGEKVFEMTTQMTTLNKS